METLQTRAFGDPAIPLIAGVFLDDKSAGDAIADLRLAGFSASDIGVAFSKEDMQGRNVVRDAAHRPQDLEEQHSIFWKIRHGLEHDLHTHGPDLSSQEDAEAVRREPAYTVIDLIDTLRARGIAEDTIHLLSREVGADGTLILVIARGREDEVRSTLELNRGFLRTAMATEQPPAQPSPNTQETAGGKLHI